MNTIIKRKEDEWLRTVTDDDVFVVIHSDYISHAHETYILGVYDDIELAKQCVIEKVKKIGTNLFMHIIKTEKNLPKQFLPSRNNKCLICNGIGNKCSFTNNY